MKYILVRTNLLMLGYKSLESQCLDISELLFKELNAYNIKVSSLYWSIGKIFSPIKNDFINLVAEFETFLTPIEIINKIFIIEKTFTINCNKYIKIVLLDYDNLIKINNIFIIPFIKLHKKSYIIKGIYEINSNWYHPVLKKNIKTIFNKIKKNELLN